MKLLEHLLVALRNFRGYDCRVHPHGELALIGYNNEGAYSPLRAFFMRYISMHPHVMVGLDGNTYGCAGYLHYQSINPIQPRHPHLIVNGKALINEGAHSHA